VSWRVRSIFFANTGESMADLSALISLVKNQSAKTGPSWKTSDVKRGLQGSTSALRAIWTRYQVCPSCRSEETTTNTVVHKLLNVPMTNGTGTVFLNINLQKMMEDPYVHGVVLPAAIGVIVALLTLLLVCSIRSCVQAQARKRRKRRIRNLAEELKADQKVLLTADSDDEI